MRLDLFNAAAKAYNNTANMPSVNAKSEDSMVFSSFLKKNYDEAIDTITGGEKMTFQYLQGKVDLTSVVTAVNNAEATLQTVVNIRDKLLAAYQEIIKMNI